MTPATKKTPPEKRPEREPVKPDQDNVAEEAKTEDQKGLGGKLRDPESDGMEFPDGTGRKRTGDLGTGN